MEPRTVKGSHVLQTKEWVDQRLGSGAFGAMTKKAGDNWTLILPMSWYEIDVLHVVFVQASRRLGISIEDMATQIARINAEKDMTSIYRFFLRLAQPERVLSHTSRLWRTYVSFGTATAICNEPGHYIGQGDGLTSEFIDWACGCWLGFIPTTIQLSGGRNAKGSIVKRWPTGSGQYSLQLEVTYR